MTMQNLVGLHSLCLMAGALLGLFTVIDGNPINGAPVVPVTSAALPFTWKTSVGCCRERFYTVDATSSGKNVRTPSSHHDTAVQETYPGISVETANNCNAKCGSDANCTAVEVTRKSKKKAKSTKCEYHTSNINSWTRASTSCKVSTCAFKVPMSAPAPAPPTPVKTAPLAPTWTVKLGCCRAFSGKTTINYAVPTELIEADTAGDARAGCERRCAKNLECTAFEFRVQKKKKKVQKYMCEQHTEPGINSSTRASKSCKKATCALKEDPVTPYAGKPTLNNTVFKDAVDTCLSVDPVNGNCTDGVHGPMHSWDVESVTNFEYTFAGKAQFNGDISRWNTKAATTTSSMFEEATAFNGDLSNWDTSSVITMEGMFYYAEAFNQDLSSWNTSSVTDMSWMFFFATAFNQDLNTWDTSSVLDLGAQTMFVQTAMDPLPTWYTLE